MGNKDQGAAAPQATAHTPGPWTANPRPGTNLIRGANGVYVANVFGVEDEEPRANAKLIAAAPALADALELALDDDGMTCDAAEDCGCWSSLARAALRAAGRLGSVANAPKAPSEHSDDCASLRYITEMNDITGLECDCAAQGEEK